MHYDNTYYASRQNKYSVGKKCSNQFFSFLHFFLTILSLRKRTYQEKMILMMILALLLLFATPFSNEFGGVVGVHGFYLPGVAPQGANFLRLFVLFVLLRVLNGV